MSILHFNSFCRRCQEGFLLLEILVSMLAGAFLVVAVMSWYVSYTRMQGDAQQRLQALELLSTYVNQIQNGHMACPQTGSSVIAGGTVRVTRTEDRMVPQFCWLTCSYAAGSLQVPVVELLVGVPINGG